MLTRGFRRLGARWKSTSASSPIGEGRLEFETRRYPTFWSRVKQQRHGLGNMALSASVAFLAVSIIKQDREIAKVTATADRLKLQNEGLSGKLDDVKAVLVKAEDDGEVPVVERLRELLELTGGKLSPVSSDVADTAVQSPSTSKFMV